MPSAEASSPKCFFAAWVFAWATAVYLPSLVITLLSLSPLASGGNLFLDTFEVADEVSPSAKLAYAIIFGALLVVARKGRAGRRLSINILIGGVSIAMVVALLPEYYSRGFGIGLNGIRFDPLPTGIYLLGGFASGLVFTISEASCLSRSRRPEPHPSPDE